MIILFIILLIVLLLRGQGPVVYKGLPIEEKHFTAVIDVGCVLANGNKTFYLNRRSGILIVKMLSTALNIKQLEAAAFHGHHRHHHH